MAAGDWYVTLQGVEQGPLTPAQVKELVQSGLIGPATPVRREGMDKPVLAMQVQGLLPPGAVEQAKAAAAAASVAPPSVAPASMAPEPAPAAPAPAVPEPAATHGVLTPGPEFAASAPAASEPAPAAPAPAVPEPGVVPARPAQKESSDIRPVTLVQPQTAALDRTGEGKVRASVPSTRRIAIGQDQQGGGPVEPRRSLTGEDAEPEPSDLDGPETSPLAHQDAQVIETRASVGQRVAARLIDDAILGAVMIIALSIAVIAGNGKIKDALTIIDLNRIEMSLSSAGDTMPGYEEWEMGVADGTYVKPEFPDRPTMQKGQTEAEFKPTLDAFLDEYREVGYERQVYQWRSRAYIEDRREMDAVYDQKTFLVAMAISVSVLLGLFYFPLMEAATGATVGKKIMKLVAVDGNYRRVSFSLAVTRQVIRLVPFGQLLAFGVTRNALHDKISKTQVVPRSVYLRRKPGKEVRVRRGARARSVAPESVDEMLAEPSPPSAQQEPSEGDDAPRARRRRR
ncbi:MAG: RDD family protein [Planctomycetota bacterium]|jgi:uncharacterized RDD family membrane protein YckC|nr:RDD family protein [Planctomycetota bacterium]